MCFSRRCSIRAGSSSCHWRGQRGAVRSGPCSAPFRAPSKPLTMGPPCVETCPPYGCGSPHASDKARLRPLKIRLLSIPFVTFPRQFVWMTCPDPAALLNRACRLLQRGVFFFLCARFQPWHPAHALRLRRAGAAYSSVASHPPAAVLPAYPTHRRTSAPHSLPEPDTRAPRLTINTAVRLPMERALDFGSNVLCRSRKEAVSQIA